MPQCLLDFVTRVVGYKALLTKWAEGDYTERRSMIGWPPEFDLYVERSYKALKAERARLLHNAVWRAWHKTHGGKRAAAGSVHYHAGITGLSDVTCATAFVSRASCGRAPL